MSTSIFNVTLPYLLDLFESSNGLSPIATKTLGTTAANSHFAEQHEGNISQQPLPLMWLLQRWAKVAARHGKERSLDQGRFSQGRLPGTMREVYISA